MKITSASPLARRTLLRGAGLSIALPFLEAMRPRRALAQPKLARRFLAFWTPNGNVMSAWTPSGDETNFTLSRILRPLEPHKRSLIVLSGVDTKSSSPAACDHYPGCMTALTGQPTPAGSVYMGQGWSPGISVDQHIGNHIGTRTKLKTLELGVGVPKFKSAMDTLSYAGKDRPLPVQCNPAEVWKRLFGDGATGDPAVAARLRLENKTVLDAVVEQYRTLAARLGAEDRRRLEAHGQHVREVETRLASYEAGSAACGGTAPPSMTASGNNPLFRELGKLQMDMAVLAFKCDVTRVITLMWGNGTSGQRFPWLGADEAHHGMSHKTDATTIERLTRVNTWFMEQLAYLITELKKIPDGAGTVHDTTVIYSTNELTDGAAHSHANAPLLLAGGAGGHFKMGRFLKYGDMPHNNLLLSLCHAFGMTDTSFGKKEWCTGPLPRLTA